jgi:twitching motility protein PilT
VSNLIREAKVFQIPSVMQTGRKYGMCQMNDSLTELVKKRVVAPEEAWAKAVDKASLLNQFRKVSIDTSWAPGEGGGPGGAA